MVKIPKSTILQTFDRIFSPTGSNFIPGSSAALETSAQLGKSPEIGQKTGSRKDAQKAAKSKWYTQKIVAPLCGMDSPLHTYYQRAWYCGTARVQEGNKVTSKYCNTRICHHCNRMRSARLQAGYLPQFELLENRQFTTLTVPNCTAEELKDAIDDLLKKWVQILNVMKKKKLLPSGLRKIEVTYNSIENTFHPHLHILIDQGLGDFVIDEWLKRYPNALRICQHVSNADDKGVLKELFKYATKIGVGKQGVIEVYAPALNQIMLALVNRRTIQTFGKVKMFNEDEQNQEAQEVNDLPENNDKDASGMPVPVIWNWNDHDWYNDNGEAYCGFEPPTKIQFVYME